MSNFVPDYRRLLRTDPLPSPTSDTGQDTPVTPTVKGPTPRVRTGSVDGGVTTTRVNEREDTIKSCLSRLGSSKEGYGWDDRIVETVSPPF